MRALVKDVRFCYWAGPKGRQSEGMRHVRMVCGPGRPRLRLIDPLATLNHPTQITRGAGTAEHQETGRMTASVAPAPTALDEAIIKSAEATLETIGRARGAIH